MKLRWGVLATVPVLATCEPPSSPDRGLPDPGPGLRILTTAAAYDRGASAAVSVANVSADTLNVSECCGKVTVLVDQWDGTHWQAVSSGYCLAMCDMSPMGLPPGDSSVGTFGTPLDPGHYRVRVFAWRPHGGGSGYAMSNRFDVR
jgi:hypothetical protein